MQITRNLVLMLATSLAVMAQSERGSITGVVTDPTGAAIVAAELSVINRDTNATSKLVTTSSGEYSAPNLPPGTYRLEITAPGFKHFVRQNIVVSASTTVRIDAKLQLGQVSEQVEVSAAVATIQTDDAKVSTQVENKLVDELPLQVAGAMRSPFNLVAVVPEAQGKDQAMSLGGGQVAAWDATLDGYSVGTNRSGDTAGGGAQHAIARIAHRIHGGYERLQGRVRTGRRRHHVVRVEIRHEQVPRLHV